MIGLRKILLVAPQIYHSIKPPGWPSESFFISLGSLRIASELIADLLVDFETEMPDDDCNVEVRCGHIAMPVDRVCYIDPCLLDWMN